jgi:hypothetical protein
MSLTDVKKLAEQLDAAQTLLDEIRITSGCRAFNSVTTCAPRKMETALETATRARDERRIRKDFIGNDDFFGEPAWDMLLDLFIRQTNEEDTSVKSAFISADTPTPTIIRWLDALESTGLVQSHADPANPNQQLIHLTPAGYAGMLHYLETIARDRVQR